MAKAKAVTAATNSPPQRPASGPRSRACSAPARPLRHRPRRRPTGTPYRPRPTRLRALQGDALMAIDKGLYQLWGWQALVVADEGALNGTNGAAALGGLL